MIKNKKMHVILLCFGLINSVMVSSNPLQNVYLAACNLLPMINVYYAQTVRESQKNIKIDAVQCIIRNEQFQELSEKFGEEDIQKMQQEAADIVVRAKTNYVQNTDLQLPALNSYSSVVSRFMASIVGLFCLTNSNPHISNIAPGVTSFNAFMFGPQFSDIYRSSLKLRDAKDFSQCIDFDSVDYYKKYLNKKEDHKKIELKNMDEDQLEKFLKRKDKKINLLTAEDLEKEAELLKKIKTGEKNVLESKYNKQDFPEVHRTNFAGQECLLAAQDRELSRKVFDNIFSGKGLSHDDSFGKLRTARQDVLSKKEFVKANKIKELVSTSQGEAIRHVEDKNKKHIEFMSAIKTQDGKPVASALLPRFERKTSLEELS